jgi:hypothetical protein
MSRALDSSARDANVLLVSGASITALPLLVLAKFQSQFAPDSLHSVSLAHSPAASACTGTQFWRDWLALDTASHELLESKSRATETLQQGAYRRVAYRGMLARRLHAHVTSAAVQTISRKHASIQRISNEVSVGNTILMIFGLLLATFGRTGMLC